MGNPLSLDKFDCSIGLRAFVYTVERLGIRAIGKVTAMNDYKIQRNLFIIRRPAFCQKYSVGLYVI